MIKHKIVIGISGASGSIYANSILNKLLLLKEQIDDIAIVMSENAKLVWQTELNSTSYNQFGIKIYHSMDFNAPFASGSAKYQTMIIIPCSMGTLGRIANGISNDLISRAADVILKERRKLILVIRDTPYNLMHIKNMETITLAGGIICPATPSFYSKPTTIEELISTVVNRVLDLAGFNVKSFRWNEDSF